MQKYRGQNVHKRTLGASCEALTNLLLHALAAHVQHCAGNPQIKCPADTNVHQNHPKQEKTASHQVVNSRATTKSVPAPVPDSALMQPGPGTTAMKHTSCIMKVDIKYICAYEPDHEMHCFHQVLNTPDGNRSRVFAEGIPAIDIAANIKLLLWHHNRLCIVAAL
jgi:hypothetical protein